MGLAKERNEARLPNSPDYDINEPNIDPVTGIPLNNGYPNGYGPLSQEVLIPAFLAAYTGKSAKKISTSPFPNIPMPNWRINYSVPKFISIIKAFNISHAYQSTYNIGSYNTNPFYNWNEQAYDGYSWVRNEINGMFIPEQQIASVSINESFNPLFSADITWAII